MSFKEFKISSLSINNRTTVYLLTVLITIIGVYSYITLPKESFPEVEIPVFNVVTIYAGASPADIENVITRPIEQELQGIDGIDEISSVSKQATSIITIEFTTEKDKLVAQQEVNDAVEKARAELPTQLTQEPQVNDFNLDDQPILNINLSGNYDLVELKKFADEIQDQIESLSDVNEAEIVGALEREIQINVDLHKMQAAGITFNDIRTAVQSKNMTVSAGQLDMGSMERSVRVDGEIEEAGDLQDLIIKNNAGDEVYLKNIATIQDGFADRESYASLNGEPVITINVKKKSGGNLIETSEASMAIIQDLQENQFPDDLKVTITGDQSQDTKDSVSNLFNTVILGFFFVVLVLMFIMGVQNAVFVGLAIPLSSLIAFAVMPTIDFSINMVVLFALILGLGIVVDNAIVIVENIYRHVTQNDESKIVAAKRAAGEIALPVITGTLTTIAPFVPLLFWGGIIGKFMMYLPITLILTLVASLLVALIMNPVFAVSFMSEEGDHMKDDEHHDNRFLWIASAVVGVLAVIFYLTGGMFVANLLVFIYLLWLLERFVLKPLIRKFNESTLPKIQSYYHDSIQWILVGKRPWFVLGGTFVFLIFSFLMLGVASPKVVFFPESEPNFVYVYNEMPSGTDLDETQRINQQIEERVYGVIGQDNPIVKSVISNVAIGANPPNSIDPTPSPNKSKVTVEFVDYQDRDGVSTQEILNEIRDNVQDIPGTTVTVEKEQNGPPTGKPINIEITGDEFEQLIALTERVKSFIQEQEIEGIEELRSDLQISNPEIIVDIDNEKANSYGISNVQIGSTIRTALLGEPVSTYRVDEDEYDVTLRLQKPDRSNITDLMNMEIPSPGGYIPISAVATPRLENSYGAINRIDLERVATLSSNVLAGYNANEINTQIRQALEDFEIPQGYEVSLTGEQEEQAETGQFLMVALLAAIMLIFLVLVAQFNSIGKPLIIMSQVLFSLIGVFIGFSTFGMDISVVLTGMGIIAVAGIVVKNGIILIDYIDILRNDGADLKKAVIEGGATRLNPVLLTAASTILGLIPLAIGLNIDFYGLFASFEPNLYFGGDNASFWGPLAWTIIYGLGFATFLTLFLVPSMYYIGVNTKIWFKEKMSLK
ncbi:efflux RND transporter permease subunit [Gracilimonas mengyeensis]|uniref:Multidrug efflux pump subunit AcrB n=1 Tax=Gracilimonas mengyeensis TaxID=1302730 RepID=A0A521F6P4_9BACT|nr:efflux RND transporter permease subunit [Gracilimonas mengyeensis]SMO91281.1 Multidrug efflux pump subunit AcrB [Gracilimonas mengyeensis]